MVAHHLNQSCRFLMALLIALCVCGQTHARRVALVIGNDQYESVDKLRNARNDARLMAGVLTKAGFLVSEASDLSRERLWSTIDAFKAGIVKGDEVVFYFAGHGVQIGSTQLLLPIDINPRSEAQVQRDGVPLIDVQDALKDARVAIFIIDACRDNPFPKQGTRTLGSTRGLLPPEPSAGQIIMLSAGRNQKALDEVPGQQSANGLFTWELAKVIQTPGIEIRTVLEQVKDAVDDKAKLANHEQRPSLVNDLRGNFYFFSPAPLQMATPAPVPMPTPVSAPAPAASGLDAAQQEEKFWDDAKAVANREAFEAYLEIYPKGRYASLARANIARLVASSLASSRPASPVGSAAVPLPAVSAVPVPLPVALPPPAVGSVFKDCDDCPEMVVLPPGSFLMGSKADRSAPDWMLKDDQPAREVIIAGFAMGRTEVSQAQWAAVMGTQPSRFNGANLPVESVSWNDAQAFVAKLNAKTGQQYRLPSEAEWEYAARANSSTRYSFGDDISLLDQHAWFSDNAVQRSFFSSNSRGTRPVSQKKPNTFGLYDMHGNVWEWVEDCWHDNYTAAPLDGSAWTALCVGDYRLLRGGSWDSNPPNLRSRYRNGFSPDFRENNIGFRIARKLNTP